MLHKLGAYNDMIGELWIVTFNKSRFVCIIIALSQLVLGLAFLAFPSAMAATMGIEPPTRGAHYIFAMLSARFLVYGAVMLMINRALARHRLWLDGMAAIQAIDLAAGLFFCADGSVSWTSAGFPMFNAALFLIALLAVRPKSEAPSHA